MRSAPITINFYDADDNITATYTRSTVPWSVLKSYLFLQSDMENMTEKEQADAISDFVVMAFGDRFSRADLDRYADAGDVLSTFAEFALRGRKVADELGFQRGTTETTSPNTTRSR